MNIVLALVTTVISRVYKVDIITPTGATIRTHPPIYNQTTFCFISKKSLKGLFLMIFSYFSLNGRENMFVSKKSKYRKKFQ